MSHILQTLQVQSIAISLSSALVASMWQGITLTFITACVLRILPRTTATARFIIWITVFTASVALPLLHLVAVQGPSPAFASRFMLDARWSYLLPAVWIMVSLFRLTMLVVEALVLRKIWKEADPIAADVLERTGLRFDADEHRVTICTTSEVDRPSVIGFFAPRILVPTWLFAQLSKTELRHVVLHEIEHLRRRDDWLNLIQKIGLVVLPLHPALFWIDRRLSIEREIACDDGVLARTKAPRGYASSLTSVAERRLAFTSPRRLMVLALGALGAGALLPRRSEFAMRIESILGQRHSSRPAVAAFLIAGVLGGTAVMAHAPDFVTFGGSVAPGLASVSAMPDRVAARIPGIASPARFEVANFRVRSIGAQAGALHNHHRRQKPKAIRIVSNKITANFVGEVATASRRKQSAGQWTLLTSWEETAPKSVQVANDAGSDQDDGAQVVVPVRRLIVHTHDGNFFVAPYAAVPTQAGWLIVQL